MIENKKTGVIILAAGSSRRLGYPKQLVKFKSKPLLQHTIDVAESLNFNTRILILGAKAEEIEKQLDIKNFTVVYNNNWEDGMSTSIKIGFSEALRLNKKLEYILVLLSDQPFVTKENIEEIIQIQLATDKQATFSEYAGEVGVPAIFSKEIFSEINKLDGDQGAKKLILDNSITYETVKFEGGNFDVDTTEDVELLKRME